MGGLIEDYIIIALRRDERLTTRQILQRLEQGHVGREYGTVSHHLRKMHYLQQLGREKAQNGQYVYWNLHSHEDDTPFDPRDFIKRTVHLPERFATH